MYDSGIQGLLWRRVHYTPPCFLYEQRRRKKNVSWAKLHSNFSLAHLFNCNWTPTQHGKNDRQWKNSALLVSWWRFGHICQDTAGAFNWNPHYFDTLILCCYFGHLAFCWLHNLHVKTDKNRLLPADRGRVWLTALCWLVGGWRWLAHKRELTEEGKPLYQTPSTEALYQQVRR